MKSKEIQSNLDKLNDQLREINNELDLIIEEFKKEIQPLVGTWIDKNVRSAVQSNPDIIQDLGIRKIKELKNEVHDLILDLPTLIEKETCKKEYWPHYATRSREDNYGRKEEAFFDRTFRNLISHIAPILDKYGLIVTPEGHVVEWEPKPNGKFKYAFNPGFMHMKVVSRTSFGEKDKERRRLVSEIEQQEQELKRAEALELFDSA